MGSPDVAAIAILLELGNDNILKYPSSVLPTPVTCIVSLTLLMIPDVGTPIDAPVKFSGNSVSPPT